MRKQWKRALEQAGALNSARVPRPLITCRASAPCSSPAPSPPRPRAGAGGPGAQRKQPNPPPLHPLPPLEMPEDLAGLRGAEGRRQSPGGCSRRLGLHDGRLLVPLLTSFAVAGQCSRSRVRLSSLLSSPTGATSRDNNFGILSQRGKKKNASKGFQRCGSETEFRAGRSPVIHQIFHCVIEIPC